MEVAPGIHVVRAYASDEAAEILAAAEASAGWVPAGINAGLTVDRAVRDAEVLFESANPALLGACRDRLFGATREIASALAAKTVLAELQIVRYHAGGHYVAHRDTPELGATPRALSIVCYLNDGFGGGATVFADPAFAVAPVTGNAVAFSPVLMHHAEPVTAGTKYVITAWYHVPPPSGAPRVNG